MGVVTASLSIFSLFATFTLSLGRMQTITLSHLLFPHWHLQSQIILNWGEPNWNFKCMQYTCWVFSDYILLPNTKEWEIFSLSEVLLTPVTPKAGVGCQRCKICITICLLLLSPPSLSRRRRQTPWALMADSHPSHLRRANTFFEVQCLELLLNTATKLSLNFHSLYQSPM